jgi:hypothetical protein
MPAFEGDGLGVNPVRKGGVLMPPSIRKEHFLSISSHKWWRLSNRIKEGMGGEVM